MIGALAAISVLAWAYTVHLAVGMSPIMMNGSASPGAHSMAMTMPVSRAWRIEDVAFTFFMWCAMMVAMMTPSAAPMILAFDAVKRDRRGGKSGISATTAFLAGYLVVWISFSAGATVLQWPLHAASLLLPGAMQVTPAAGGLMLMVAGAYQLTELKNSCLATCRSPMSFLITEWREGGKGAFIMGARHGIYCVGCCWSIMLVLFVAGVMNLLWVAGIAVFVLLEKTIPGGRWMTRLAGLAAIVWGVWLLLPVVVG